MAYIGSKMTGYQYNEANIDKVIFGVGAFENHGYHMPFGTDTLISNAGGKSSGTGERPDGSPPD
jgi:creatinine amidohydrolase